MKTASADLFDLIHLLSPSEKSYFKKFASALSHGGKTGYMKLFDAIQKQEHYDEAALLKKFRNHPIGKNFAYNKIYLFNLIMRSLKLYHQDRNVDLSMLDMLEQVEILIQVGFYSYAKKLVDKLEQKAKKYDNYSLLHLCLKYKHALTQGGKVVTSMKDAYSINLKAVTVAEDILKNSTLNMLYNGLYYTANVYRYTLDAPQEKDFDQLAEKLFSMPAPTKEKPHLYYRYISTCLVYYTNKDDSRKVVFCYDEILQFFKTNKHFIEIFSASYLINMGNSIAAYKQYGYMQKVYTVLRQLKNAEVSGERDIALKWFLYYASLASVALHYGDFQLFLKEASAAFRFMDGVDDFIRRKFYYNFYYDAACIYTLSGSYDAAMEQINKLTQSEVFHTLKDVQLRTYTLAAMLVYHQKNSRLLKHYITTANRYFKKYKKTNTQDFAVLEFLKGAEKITDAIDVKPMLSVLKKTLAAKENELLALSYDTWIESLLQGMPYEKLRQTVTSKESIKTKAP